MHDDFPFSPATVAAAAGPVVHLRCGADGLPVGSTAAGRVPLPAARVWAVLSDPERMMAQVPTVSRVRRDGDRLVTHLKFKFSLFSVGFDVESLIRLEPQRRLDLTWKAGEPRDLHMRFDVAPLPGEDACLLYAGVGFDLFSLGWLVKYFLRHHPEIRFGVFSGTSLTLLDAVQRIVDGRKPLS